MKAITATYKGLLTGAAMIIACSVCYFALKIPVNSWEQFVVLTIYVAGIAWSLLAFKAESTAQKSFKVYFQVGFKVFIVVTLLMVIYYAFYYIYNTEIRDAWIADNNVLLIKEGNKMPAEIAENAKQMKSIFLPMMLGINLFKYLLVGALVTIIGAGFLSQKKNH